MNLTSRLCYTDGQVSAIFDKSSLQVGICRKLSIFIRLLQRAAAVRGDVIMRDVTNDVTASRINANRWLTNKGEPRRVGSQPQDV